MIDQDFKMFSDGTRLPTLQKDTWYSDVLITFPDFSYLQQMSIAYLVFLFL